MNNVAGTIVDATGANPNVDAFTFEVAEGTLLDGIFLNESTVNVAFLGINDSNTFPFDAAKLGSSFFLALVGNLQPLGHSRTNFCEYRRFEAQNRVKPSF